MLPRYTNHLKECVCVCVHITHCIEVPHSLEGEPLSQAHPVLISHRREPSAQNHTGSYENNHPHMCTGVNNSCRQQTGMKLCLSLPVTQSSSLGYVQRFAFSMRCISLFSHLLQYISLSHSSTHSADRLTRKFHFLTDARTHIHTNIHGSVSIVTRPHQAAVTEKGREQMSVCQSRCSKTRYLRPPTPTPPHSNYSRFRCDHSQP